MRWYIYAVAQHRASWWRLTGESAWFKRNPVRCQEEEARQTARRKTASGRLAWLLAAAVATC